MLSARASGVRYPGFDPQMRNCLGTKISNDISGRNSDNTMRRPSDWDVNWRASMQGETSSIYAG